jgi:hypothetical protein
MNRREEMPWVSVVFQARGARHLPKRQIYSSRRWDSNSDVNFVFALFSWRNQMKHFVFRQYGWITIVLVALGVFVVSFTRPERFLEVLLTWIGGTFSFVFFVQRQALEELRLSKELFTELNRRYDNLNEALNRIAARDPAEELESHERDKLNDYFNLCAEEYLFYRQGYIYPEVWEAWLNGMKIFYRQERIGRYWRSELKSESYYGLRLD